MIVKKLMEEFGEEVIRSFVQKNADYYIARWRLMAQKGSRVSWNWAAAVFGGWFYQSWFFYRKMLLYGIAAFLLFWGGSLLLAVALGALLAVAGVGERAVDAVATLTAVAVSLLPFLIAGLYGNYIYGRFTYWKLVKLRERAGGNEEELLSLAAAKEGTSVALIVVGILIEFFTVGLIGLLLSLILTSN